MPRYQLTIEYDGTSFVGWQVQRNGRSVQGQLAAAVGRFTGQDVVPAGAGRTDAGVHASGQVAHLDLTKDWPSDTVRDALNAHLKPDPIAVIACVRVSDTFDARFSARRRHYLYRLIDRRAPLVLERNRAWQVPVALDAEAMHAAGQALVGHHDFTTFRSVQCQAKSPVKTIDGVIVNRAGEIIEVRVWARSFMHNQVRSMVGTLKEVGAGKWAARDVEHALAACDRSRCGPVAPAHGLYLTRVEYPDLDPCT